ncbi:MAG TPA: hypothetical protein VFR76_06565, partial [Verrucomicrobiae bacterium]|nr:hypothetical protein [Verrucomicrobiae bacterium]
TGRHWAPEDRIPQRVYFDMNQKSPEHPPPGPPGYVYPPYGPPVYYGPPWYYGPPPYYGPGVRFYFGPPVYYRHRHY